MVRKEHYFINDKEVTKNEWDVKFKDENNLDTLTIKFEEVKEIDYLFKYIEDLKGECEKLKRENESLKLWDSFRYPKINPHPNPTTQPYTQPNIIYCCDGSGIPYTYQNTTTKLN